MKKKIISLLLVLTVILNVLPVFSESSAQEDITVYITISQYCEFVSDKNGEQIINRKLTLSGKSEYTLDDAFLYAHELFYPEGVEGYASSIGDWGLGVDKFWGDTSYNFGYQVNGGTATVSGPGYILSDGDHIDAMIYKNQYPETEAYTSFNTYNMDAVTDKEITLNLKYISGYDYATMESILSACEDAQITIDGEETQYTTDADGNVTVTFEEPGTYIVSAKKDKAVNDVVKPAIAAPVCVINVEARQVVVMHNIAKAYSESDFLALEGNLPWVIADMIAYEMLFPESENILNDQKREEVLKLIVSSSKEAEYPGDLAKHIIALSALGYDSTKIFTDDFQKINLVEKLNTLAEAEDEFLTNIYTLPYVIIALNQATDFADQETMNYLINTALESKALWQDVELNYGTDAMTPMIQALAPYYGDPDIKTIIDESIVIVKSQQREDGLINGFAGYESASTALAVCALSTLGINCEEVAEYGVNLIDGLMATADESLTEFPNPFATEQGFRGLLSWYALSQENQRDIYDFSCNDLTELNMTGVNGCGVRFDVTPNSAQILVSGANSASNNIFDLNEGIYEYTISAPGYYDSTGSIEIVADDVENHKLKVVTQTLSPISYSGGGGGGGSASKPKPEEKDETETTDERTEDDIAEDDTPDVIELTETTFADVNADDWFFPSVKYVYENNLFTGTGKNFEPETTLTRGMMVTVLYRIAKPDDDSADITFEDVEGGMWYSDAVAWAAENKIVNGVSKNAFAPDMNITREQLVTIIYRFLLMNGFVNNEGTSIDDSFADADMISGYAKDAMEYAVSVGIIQGKDSKHIAPLDEVTRAEAATIITRLMSVKD